jgi:inosine/xanthosine triphosphate pyrophosphatase family protein
MTDLKKASKMISDSASKAFEALNYTHLVERNLELENEAETALNNALICLRVAQQKISDQILVDECQLAQDYRLPPQKSGVA